MRKMAIIHFSRFGNTKIKIPAMMARIGDKLIPNTFNHPLFPSSNLKSLHGTLPCLREVVYAALHQQLRITVLLY